MRVVAVILFLLFFSPFVSCTDRGVFNVSTTEMTGAELATSTLVSSVQNRNQYQRSDIGGTFLLIALLLQPLAAIMMWMTAGRLANSLDSTTTTMLPDASLIQIVLICHLVVLGFFFFAIKFNEMAAFLMLQWGYKASVVTTLSGIIVARMWNGSREKLQYLVFSREKAERKNSNHVARNEEHWVK